MKNISEVDENNLVETIQQELDRLSSCQRYRSMWHTLRLEHAVCVPRGKVQMILKELDLLGTAEKKSPSIEENNL